ncbi:glycoside hydrolase family 2 protein [Chitinophaga oryziterrae]|nr:sugar-binding domain-containing protein [Chitinophaga oryziterrae]
MKPNWKMQPVPVQTRWAKEVFPTNVLPEYPRPQLIRKDNWQNLNGLWDYTITDTSASVPSDYQGQILVPFSLESALSGVQKPLLPSQNLWYRRSFIKPKLKRGQKILLNFGAVDWQATVFVNGKEVGKHTGGYTAFSFDITDMLQLENNELVVKVFDPTDAGFNPHGKQTLYPANIYYTAISGIWQTVWLETVSASRIVDLGIKTNIENGTVMCNINSEMLDSNIQMEVTISTERKILNRTIGKYKDLFSLKIPNVRLWSPEDPFLYDLSVKLLKKGKVVDEVNSYFGMRKVDIQKDSKGIDRIFLNNRPYFNLGTLDQGYWPEGLYTAPTDAALKFDIEVIKAMGFNTIRKHIKVEPARWYYYADKIGVLVWQDFVNPPPSLPDNSKNEFEKESKEIMDQLDNYTCITTWVLFNERWGSYDQKRLTEWVKKRDPSRIVNGHTGELLYINNQLRSPSDSPYVSSDITDLHSYPYPMMAVKHVGKAMVCGEFGGVGVSVPGHQWTDLQGWGYIQVKPKELEIKYKFMIDTLSKLREEGLSASIYTEPFDVEGEENGLLTYDREIVKIPIEKIQRIHNPLIQSNKLSLLYSNSLIVKNIDLNDTDDQYKQFLALYESGKRDSIFLRRLTLMAFRLKDQKCLTKIGKSYIDKLTCLYTKENLFFISNITRTTDDEGFRIFQSNPEKINKILGRNEAENMVKSIISNEYIEPFLHIGGSSPNWDKMATLLKSKYGVIGSEKVFGTAMIYYLDRKDWNSFGKYYSLYYKTALSRSEYHINNISWLLFQNVNSPEDLEMGCQTMKYSIEHFDQLNFNAYDTYANLLYKLGKREAAIEWEERAKEMAPTYHNVIENLKKMKEGINTWK